MHRIHSDVSENDPQGNLARRTITTSYTSLLDATTGPLRQNKSNLGPVPPHCLHHSFWATGRDIESEEANAFPTVSVLNGQFPVSVPPPYSFSVLHCRCKTYGSLGES